MKKWLIFGKWVQSSGALPPRQFYTQESRALFLDFNGRQKNDNCDNFSFALVQKLKKRSDFLFVDFNKRYSFFKV